MDNKVRNERKYKAIDGSKHYLEKSMLNKNKIIKMIEKCKIKIVSQENSSRAYVIGHFESKDELEEYIDLCLYLEENDDVNIFIDGFPCIVSISDYNYNHSIKKTIDGVVIPSFRHYSAVKVEDTIIRLEEESNNILKIIKDMID